MNGVFCSENESLWRMVRDEWGFRGAVITDWYVDKLVSFCVSYKSFVLEPFLLLQGCC